MSSHLASLKRFAPYLPILAALLGLLLGLLIGWVWWPVEWTNALVTDLAPDQRAGYVSAVADAYLLDGTQASADRMVQRMAAFGDARDEAIVAAMQYYQSQPVPDAVQIGNIGRLATDLGVPVDAALMAAVASGQGAAESATVDELPAADVAPDAATGAAGAEGAPAIERGRWRGVLTWVLAILVSVALIGGGVYLLLQLRARPDGRP